MICRKCGRTDLIDSDFNKDRSKPNGLRGECKQCQRVRAREYRASYYRRNQMKIIAYQTKRYHMKKDKILVDTAMAVL
jgi:hypothetical protein